jgi:tetratricopeptide (TPR) repeat protein
MTKVALIKFLMLYLFISTSVYGQKVKYKDIFGLLSTKQYEAAEPFLKKYLKENDDNPNAYLFMGTIFHEKSAKDDILKQTERAIAHMDSAIYYYDKAYKTITEKEVKKNDEYYVLYNRRDLRTGEFGVKLSDIQFDLEKKMEGLRERIDRLKMVKHYFTLSDSLYKKSTALFHAIQANYKSQNEFFLLCWPFGLIR